MFALLILFTSSCQQDTLDELQNPNPVSEFDFKTKEGRLVFDSFEGFQTLMQSFEDSTNSKAIIDDLQQRNFMSLEAYSQLDFLNGRVENEENVTDSLIDDPHLRHLVNTDLELEIEGLIYRVGSKSVYMFAPEKRPELLTFLENETDNLSRLRSDSITTDGMYQIQEGVFTYYPETPIREIDTTIVTLEDSIIPNGRLTMVDGNKIFTVTTWMNNFFYYKAGGVKATLKKKKRKCFVFCWDRWVNERATSIQLDWINLEILTYYEKDFSNVKVYTDSDIKSNESEINKTLYTHWGAKLCFHWGFPLPCPSPWSYKFGGGTVKGILMYKGRYYHLQHQ